MADLLQSGPGVCNALVPGASWLPVQRAVCTGPASRVYQAEAQNHRKTLHCITVRANLVKDMLRLPRAPPAAGYGGAQPSPEPPPTKDRGAAPPDPRPQFEGFDQ